MLMSIIGDLVGIAYTATFFGLGMVWTPSDTWKNVWTPSVTVCLSYTVISLRVLYVLFLSELELTWLLSN